MKKSLRFQSLCRDVYNTGVKTQEKMESLDIITWKLRNI